MNMAPLLRASMQHHFEIGMVASQVTGYWRGIFPLGSVELSLQGSLLGNSMRPKEYSRIESCACYCRVTLRNFRKRVQGTG